MSKSGSTRMTQQEQETLDKIQQCIENVNGLEKQLVEMKTNREAKHLKQQSDIIDDQINKLHQIINDYQAHI